MRFLPYFNTKKALISQEVTIRKLRVSPRESTLRRQSTTLLVEMLLSVIEIHPLFLCMMTPNHLSESHPEQQLPAC
jgi:hypothetical protein